MKERLQHIHFYLKKMNMVKYIFSATLFSFIVILPLIPVFELLEYIMPEGEYEVVDFDRPIYSTIRIILLGPLLETLVYQFVIIEFLSRFKSISKIILVLISASLFAFAHYYSLSYIFFAFIMGIILAYSYLLHYPNKKKAFLVVFFIHSLRNLITHLVHILFLR